MDKETIKNYGGCLIWILIIMATIFIGYSSRDWGKEYLVEETNYIHKTNNADKCKFIKNAKDREYKISRISKSDAIYKEKKMCKVCYSSDEQVEYNKELLDRKKRNLHLNDRIVWFELEYKQDADFNRLFVYMESSGKLHINGDCFEIKSTPKRMNLNDIKSINTTCEDCVGREYVDFIYKKINVGIYDRSLIGEPEDDD